MVCTISCAIAAIFIIGMIYMNIAVYTNKTVKNYRDQLPDDLKNKYDQITKERTKIYYEGYILGFVLSLFLIIYNYKIKDQKLSTLSIVCIVLATSFITNYFYYILYPKTNWMLDNITDQAQTKAWLDMYKHMQMYYHTGLLLGLVAIMILAFAFRC